MDATAPTRIVTGPAPVTAIYVPPALWYFCDHPWPVDAPCQHGIWARCAGCARNYAPCTTTPLPPDAIDAIRAEAWLCPACRTECDDD